MELTVLGFYGGYPYNNIGTSGYLLKTKDFNLLIDCGSGVLMSLENVLDPLKLNAVILSHYHADHIADVGVLQYYWQLHEKRYQTDILPIYGHTLDKVQFFDALTWPNATQKVAFDPNKVSNIGPFDISFLKTVHPVPAFAIRIKNRDNGKVLVYTADSRYFEELIDFSQNADLMIADTNFFANKTDQIWHMTTAQVGELAKKAKVKKLLISHLPQVNDFQRLLSETKKAVDGKVDVVLPKVGMKINL